MSLVLCKKSSQNEMITLEDMMRDRLLSLGIPEIYTPQGMKKTFVRPHVKRCGTLRMAHYQEGVIIILSLKAKEKLVTLAEPLQQEYLANLIFCKAALLIFAQSMTLPAPLKKLLNRYHLPTAISFLSEHLLESRIKAIIQEKIKRCITVHGVALEMQGRGILITGPSGIGKTTAALQVMSEDSAWIADDRAVIKKNKSGQLIISGHKIIKNYFHTGETGIMPVDRVLNASQIKFRTALAAVIDVIRAETDDVSSQFIEKNILETTLPCLRIGIPRTGYLDKNLLREATHKFPGVG